jgi:holliday junction DNA helicase motor protein
VNVEQIEKKLKNCKKSDMIIKKLQLKLESLNYGLLAGSNQTNTRVTTSKTNTTENKLLETLQLKDEVIEQLNAIVNERIEVMDLIDQLDEIEEWLVLTMLYVNNLPLTQICREMKISKVNVYRIRKQALDHLAGMVNTD